MGNNWILPELFESSMQTTSINVDMSSVPSKLKE